jgi:guanylate kinase
MVGPSGSGKTTVGEALTKRGIPKLVTTTTRLPRPGEKEGVDYYFKHAEELDPDDFIEQTIYNNRVYGLTKREVEKALEKHDIVHVSLDRNGSKAMKEAFPKETRVVFIRISKETMEKRMRKRGDSEEKIAERIAHSQLTGELIPPKETDFVVENTNIEQTVQEILKHLNLPL